MAFRIRAASLHRFENVIALMVGAFLAVLTGWAQIHYVSLQERIAVWHLVGAELQENNLLLENHRKMDQLKPGDVSPTKTLRYNIRVPSQSMVRGYDLVTEKALADLSEDQVGAITAYYADLRNLNERISMFQNFLVIGTLRESEASLMPLVMRHYASISATAGLAYDRSSLVRPMVAGIERGLRRQKHEFQAAFVCVSVLMVLMTFVLVVAVASRPVAVPEPKERAA